MKTKDILELKFKGFKLTEKEKKDVEGYFEEIDEVIKDRGIENADGFSEITSRDISGSSFKGNIVINTYKMLIPEDDILVRAGVFESFGRRLFSYYNEISPVDVEILGYIGLVVSRFKAGILDDLFSDENLAKKDESYKSLMNFTEVLNLLTTADIPKEDYVKKNMRKYSKIRAVLPGLYLRNDEIYSHLKEMDEEKDKLKREVFEKLRVFSKEYKDNVLIENLSLFTISTGLMPAVFNKKDITLNDVLRAYEGNKERVSFKFLLPNKDFIRPDRFLPDDDDKFMEYIRTPLNKRENPKEIEKHPVKAIIDTTDKISFEEFALKDNIYEKYPGLKMDEFFKAVEELKEYAPDLDEIELDEPVVRRVRVSTRMKFWNTKSGGAEADEMTYDELSDYRKKRIYDIPVSTTSLRYEIFFKMLSGDYYRLNHMNYYSFVRYLKNNLHHISFSDPEKDKENTGEFSMELLVCKLYFMYEFEEVLRSLTKYMLNLMKEDKRNSYFVNRTMLYFRNSISFRERSENTTYEKDFNKIYQKITNNIRTALDFSEEFIEKDLMNITEEIGFTLYGRDKKKGEDEIIGFMKEQGISKRAMADKINTSRTNIARMFSKRQGGMNYIDFLLMCEYLEKDAFDVLPKRVFEISDSKKG